MESIKIKQLIEGRIPGAEAAVAVSGDGIDLIVCFEARRQLDAHRQILSILSEAGVFESTTCLAIRWFADQAELLAWKVRALVIEALGPDARNRSEPNVRIRDEVLEIRCCELAGSSAAASAQARITSVRERLLSLAKAKWIDLQFSPRHSESAWQWGYRDGSDASNYDDDDVVINPNWPSKTGNPSGGGRGNNPPRR